jgi:Tol biopolymer transport system component
VRQAVFSTTLEGKLEREWQGMLAPEFSADGQSIAYLTLNPADQTVLSVTTPARTRVWTPLPEGYAVDAAFSPSGRWLAALLVERNDYSGRLNGPRVFLLDTAEFQRTELAAANVLGGAAAWSPKGNALLVAGTEVVAEGYRLNLRLLSIPGGQVKQVVDGKIGGVSADFPLFTRLEWLP